jgi:hypothetical protein
MSDYEQRGGVITRGTGLRHVLRLRGAGLLVFLFKLAQGERTPPKKNRGGYSVLHLQCRYDTATVWSTMRRTAPAPAPYATVPPP